MSAEFDGATYDRYLWREADRYWGGEEGEETAAEARARMTAEEVVQDQQWERQQQDRGER